MKTVFLGGTCNNSTWRDLLIPQLSINYFNPVLESGVEWTNEHQQEEIKQRNECDINLYVLTPEMTGFLSVFEIGQDSKSKPHRTVFSYMEATGGERFNQHDLKALRNMTKQLVKDGVSCVKFNDLPEYLNNC